MIASGNHSDLQSLRYAPRNDKNNLKGKIKMSKKNGKSLWKEFTEFAIKGNAMALAVGTIIGGAFSTITKSLTDDLIMPLVNIFLGGADFSQFKIALPRMPWVEPTYETVVNEAGEEVVQLVQNYLTLGNFISAVINFFILAAVVFAIVKGINALSEIGKKKEAEVAEEPVPPAPSAEEVLLTEIRDLLKDKSSST